MFIRLLNKVARILFWLIYSVVLMLCAIELNVLGMFGYSPDARAIQSPVQHYASEVYTADSVLIGRYFWEDRTPVTYEELSPNLINALIATEDKRFYEHRGIDFSAVIAGIVSTAKGDRRGGSTITQQLAKNLYKIRFEQSQGWLHWIPGINILVIKLKEWITAHKLEANYSKEQIITLYLNTVSFGNNAYGISSATKRYYQKSPVDITVDEAAMLIGLLKGTSLYNPLRNPDHAIDRRNTVLAQMYGDGYINESVYTASMNEGLNLRPLGPDEDLRSDSYLRAAVLRWIEPWCEENGYNIYADGLTIYTAIDSRIQKHAENAMEEQMRRLQRVLDSSWEGVLPWRNSEGDIIPDFIENLARKLPKYDQLLAQFDGDEEAVFETLSEPKPMEVFTWGGPREVQYSVLDSLAHYVKMLNMGLMSMHPQNGHIKAWIGGVNYDYFKFDHVWQARRQSGSTFKPFVYLAALESGMGPCDRLIDRPVRIDYEEDGELKRWEPKNADWVFTGREMSLRWAMGKSVNSITAQLTEQVGWDQVAEVAERSGIRSPLTAVPSIGLGSSDVSLFEMVNAYATFVNDGKRVEPQLVLEVVDHRGTQVFSAEVKEKQVLRPEDAWLMTYMLRGGVEEPEGTSQALWAWDLWRNSNQIGGKTGTSSDYADGWYIGVTEELVTGVWVGCDNRSIRFRNSRTGEASRTALPVFGSYMERLYRDAAIDVQYLEFSDPSVPITRRFKCPSAPVAIPDTNSSIERLLPPTIRVPSLEEMELKNNDVSIGV